METSGNRVLLHIGGMTCVNCQNKIENELNQTSGVIHAGVSYSSGTADIVYDPSTISIQDLILIIEQLDYEVLDAPQEKAPDITRMVCILVIIIALYVMLQSMGILNLLVPSQLANTKMGYGMLLIVGLLTSVHCVAMCGGINISQCIPQMGQTEENERKTTAFRPALLYNLGRVVSYTVIGFVLGLLGFLIGGGTEVGVNILLQGILKIIAGVLMVVMGVNMLGLFPALRKLTIRMPRSLARKVSMEKAKNNRPLYVGLLNGFMPCGPLQSMWIVALATGSPFAGALSMFLFSLGTVPLMLGLGSIVSALGRKFTDKVMTVGAVLVVVLGLAMLSQGGTLSGWLSSDLLLIIVIALSAAGVLLRLPAKEAATRNLLKLTAIVLVVGSVVFWNERSVSFGSETADNGGNAEIIDGVQVVYSTLEAGRYPNITVQAGVPVKWVITAPEGSINGCNYKMLIRDLDVEYTFQTGENVLTFTVEETGTIRYSCWMGMIHGNIFVTDGTEDGAAAVGDVTVPTPSGYTIPTDEIAVASMVTDSSGAQLQEVNIRLTDQGFTPAVVVVQKEVNTLWTIDVDLTDAGTGVDLLAPYYATILTLRSGENQLTLYPTEDFDIATGDYQAFAYLKVVDDLETADEAAICAEAAEYEPLIYPSSIYGSGMSCCS